MRKTLLIGILATTAVSAYGAESSQIESSATAAVTAGANGTIGLTGATFPVNESAGSVLVTAIRKGATKGAYSVTYTTSNGTAIAGTNYTTETGTLNWANGDGSNKTFTIPINTKNVFSGVKWFRVTLKAGANTILGDHTNADVNITGGSATTTTPPSTSGGFVTFPDTLPAAGSKGTDAIPSGAGLEDVSKPTHVIGNGTAASCTSAALVAAVKTGGIITFDCGSAPVTITMTATAELFNNGAQKTVIDGGGLVTLSGGNARRILYMNTCDSALVWTTSQCNNQEYPQLTVQNLTFKGGNASNETIKEGGAIYATGGRLKVVNSRFFSNVCASTGPDTAGGAIYAFEQWNSLPVFVTHSTFGAATNLSNSCSNGAAVGSIGVSWTIVNSVMSYNHALGNGGNPAASGTPGGGSGGAIYNDGNTMVLSVNGSTIEYNTVNAFGSAIFFVSDNLTGSIDITDSTIMGNTGGSWYDKYPQISAEDETPITVKNSTIAN